MSTNMHNLDGWIEVTCRERDRVWAENEQTVVTTSSLTDPDGIYGDPIIYTEWGLRTDDGHEAILRDYIKRGESCTHYAPERGRANP
jgi:hypothetical protein